MLWSFAFFVGNVVVGNAVGCGGDVVAGNKFCALSTCGATRKVR